jgi:hypothetical protein
MTKSNYPDRFARRALMMAAETTEQSSLLSFERPQRYKKGPAQGGLVFDDILIVGMHNVPSAAELETVTASFPQAALTLDRWLENWVRVLEDNPTARRIAETKTRVGGNYKTEIQFNTNRHNLFSGILNGDHPGRHGLRRLLNADYYGRHLRGRQRNFLHHYVDDAHSFLSFASAQPGLAVLWTSVDDLMFVYTGMDTDGMLTFDHLSSDERKVISKLLEEKHEDDGKYWNWPPIANGMRRESREAVDHLDAAEILIDMAHRGHSRAFVKAIKSKCGTWTVDLSGVKTRQDALRSLLRDGFDSSDSFRHGLVVQEHLPTTREQRFFITNGRIVASVCSDRNLNGTFRREGRFFDERVAVIERPEVTGGEFERGQTSHEIDRPLAAAFARAARKIVREMRAEGRLHYVVDMGLTERGVVAIEINSFFRSGPYCLDRRRVTNAHRRALTETQKIRAAANLKISLDRKAVAAERLTSSQRLAAERERDWQFGDADQENGLMTSLETDNIEFSFDDIELMPDFAPPTVTVEAVKTSSVDIHAMAERIATNSGVREALVALDYAPPVLDKVQNPPRPRSVSRPKSPPRAIVRNPREPLKQPMAVEYEG